MEHCTFAQDAVRHHGCRLLRFGRNRHLLQKPVQQLPHTPLTHRWRFARDCERDWRCPAQKHWPSPHCSLLGIRFNRWRRRVSHGLAIQIPSQQPSNTVFKTLPNVQTSPYSGLSSTRQCRSFLPMKPHTSSNWSKRHGRFRIFSSSRAVQPCPTRTPNRMIVSR